MGRDIFEQNTDDDFSRQEHEMHNAQPSYDIQVIKNKTVPEMQNQLDFLVFSVENGDANSLEVFAVIKKIEKMFKEAKEKLDPYAIEDAEKEGKSSFVAYGQAFEIRNGGRTFDFKGIQEYEDAKKHLKDIEEKYKQAYLSKEKGLMVASADAEEMQLPIVTFRKNSLIVK